MRALADIAGLHQGLFPSKDTEQKMSCLPLRNGSPTYIANMLEEWDGGYIMGRVVLAIVDKSSCGDLGEARDDVPAFCRPIDNEGGWPVPRYIACQVTLPIDEGME